MILEGIVTTRNETGEVNIAPMGPFVDATMETLRLRPYQTSQTYQNLKRHGQGVFHVIDDVLLLARAAIGDWETRPELVPAEKVQGSVLKATCRWYEFEVTTLDDSLERTDIQTRVIHTGKYREFFGFNRAKHAVLEAAILATRLHLLTAEQVFSEFERLSIPVQKTAGEAEVAAFRLLQTHVDLHYGRRPAE